MKTLSILLILVGLPFLSQATCGAMGGGGKGLLILFGGAVVVGIVIFIGVVWGVIKLVKHFSS